MLTRFLESSIKVWHVVASLLVFFLAQKFNLSLGVLQGKWNLLVDAVTLISLWFAIYSWNKRNKQEKKHVLMGLKAQLGVIKTWTKGNNDAGWSRDDCTSERSIKTWKHPFNNVFSNDDRALPILWSLPGIIDFDSEEQKLLAEFNQRLHSFNEMLVTVRSYKESISMVRLVDIQKKLEGNRALSNEDEELIRPYACSLAYIHETLIGNDEKNGLYKMRNELERIVDHKLSAI